MLFYQLVESCTCGRRTLQEDIAGSRAIFSGKVLYTDRSIQLKWLRFLSDLNQFTNMPLPEYDPRRHGVSVTFQVINSWKGQQEDAVTLITGLGTCSIPFEVGDEALVFVHNYFPNSEDLSICSRTQPLAGAAADLAALGPPMKSKLIHKNIALHLLKQNIFGVILLLCLVTTPFIYFKWRKIRARNNS